jgi:hypothetical protein
MEDVGIKFRKRKVPRLLSELFEIKGLRWQVLLNQRNYWRWLVMPKARKLKEFVMPKEGKAKKSSFRRKGKEKLK